MALNVLDFEASVGRLLKQADTEVRHKKIYSDREKKIQQAIEELTEKFTALIQQIEQSLDQYKQIKLKRNSPEAETKQQLQTTLKEIKENLKNVKIVAAEVVDEELLQAEAKLLEARQADEIQEWRQGLKQDLLEQIETEVGFFNVADLAILIWQHLDDLKAIEALEDIETAMIDRLNYFSAADRPPIKPRRTPEETLWGMYEKAQQFRTQAYRPRLTQSPAARHRKSVDRPHPYRELFGTIVVAGGHSKLEKAVRNKLAGSRVTLHWVTVDASATAVKSAANRVSEADLVLVVTGYAGRQQTAPIQQAARDCQVPIELIQTTGMSSVLEAIVQALQPKALKNALDTTVMARMRA